MIIFFFVTLITKSVCPNTIVITPELLTYGVKIPMPDLFSALETVEEINTKLKSMWLEEYVLSIPK